MILKLIIGFALFYYVGLIIWLMLPEKEKQHKAKPISKKAKTIIGKTTYVVMPPMFTSHSENQSNLEPMDVDFDIEYEDEMDEEIDFESEELILMTSNEIETAQGLSFEEMVEVVDVIQQKEVSEELERKTVQAISMMQQTDIFDLMIEQINDGRKRVAEMLSRYDIVEEASVISDADEQWKEFDLGEYL